MPNPLGVSDKKAIEEANLFSVLEGVKAQNFIINNGECPNLGKLWNIQNNLPEYDYKIYIPNNENSREKVPVWFKCDEELNFNIWVRYSIDSDLAIVGGINRELKIRYGHFTERKVLTISPQLNEGGIKKLLAREKLITIGSI